MFLVQASVSCSNLWDGLRENLTDLTLSFGARAWSKNPVVSSELPLKVEDIDLEWGAEMLEVSS